MIKRFSQYYEASSEIESIKAELVTCIQRTYDGWIQDDDGFDECIGYGGISQDIAYAIQDTLTDNGIECVAITPQTTPSQCCVIAKTASGVYSICSAPSKYEMAEGNIVRKLADVAFTADDIQVELVDDNPENYQKHIQCDDIQPNLVNNMEFVVGCDIKFVDLPDEIQRNVTMQLLGKNPMAYTYRMCVLTTAEITAYLSACGKNIDNCTPDELALTEKIKHDGLSLPPVGLNASIALSHLLLDRSMPYIKINGVVEAAEPDITILKGNATPTVKTNSIISKDIDIKVENNDSQIIRKLIDGLSLVIQKRKLRNLRIVTILGVLNKLDIAILKFSKLTVLMSNGDTLVCEYSVNAANLPNIRVAINDTLVYDLEHLSYTLDTMVEKTVEKYKRFLESNNWKIKK